VKTIFNHKKEHLHRRRSRTKDALWNLGIHFYLGYFKDMPSFPSVDFRIKVRAPIYTHVFDFLNHNF